jgi:hypothetical protein
VPHILPDPQIATHSILFLFVAFVSLAQTAEKVFNTHRMKIWFPFWATLFLAMTAHGATHTNTYAIKGLGVYGTAAVRDDCFYTSISFSAFEEVIFDPTWTPSYAFVNIHTEELCTSSHITSDSLGTVLVNKMKGSVTKGVTLFAGIQGTKCTVTSSEDYISCEPYPTWDVLKVVFTPTGSSYTGPSQEQYSTPYTRTRVRFNGTSVDARVDFSGTVIDGIPFTPGSSDFKYGEIFKYTSGSVNLTDFFEHFNNSLSSTFIA